MKQLPSNNLSQFHFEILLIKDNSLKPEERLQQRRELNRIQ